jgi:8-amino-7-oxononanoate synthase
MYERVSILSLASSPESGSSSKKPRGRRINAGVYVNLALPPGTPDGSCLLRCSLSAAHTPAQVQRVCKVFEEAHRALKTWQDTQSAAE